jgi:hypothetical protein
MLPASPSPCFDASPPATRAGSGRVQISMVHQFVRQAGRNTEGRPQRIMHRFGIAQASQCESVTHVFSMHGCALATSLAQMTVTGLTTSKHCGQTVARIAEERHRQASFRLAHMPDPPSIGSTPGTPLRTAHMAGAVGWGMMLLRHPQSMHQGTPGKRHADDAPVLLAAHHTPSLSLTK